MTSKVNSKNISNLSHFLIQEELMLPKLESEFDKISHLVTHLFQEKSSTPKAKRDKQFFWDANHFGLNNVSIFQNFSEDQKNFTLELLTNHILNESCMIERAGISYAAKMILASENEEEKILYASIASDESVHLWDTKKFLKPGIEKTYQGNSFLTFIANLVQNGSPKLCRALLQLSLEGYGITYYSWLKGACLDEEFSKVLQRILIDEASHHGSGLIMTTNCEFNKNEIQEIEDAIVTFSTLLNCNTFPIVGILDALTGGMTDEQRRQVFKELKTLEANTQRIDDYTRLLKVSKLDQKISPKALDEAKKVKTIDESLELYKNL